MTTATIQPLPSGTAVLEMHGMTQPFASWEAAVAYARRHDAFPFVLPFPTPAVEALPEVLSVAPALRVLP